MRLVGLTGGIASGKSTVSSELQDRGLPVLDADKIARAALRKGTAGYKRVVDVFGKEILQADGEVDRARFGDMVFADPEKRSKLNAALRPVISRNIFCEVFKHWLWGTRVLILDVPLLFETGLKKFTSPVIVVWVDRETQEHRLMTRDGISREQAQNRVNSQKPLDWKRDQADIVIDNSGTLEQTKLQIEQAWGRITGPSTWKEVLCSRDFVGILLAALCLTGIHKLWATSGDKIAAN